MFTISKKLDKHMPHVLSMPEKRLEFHISTSPHSNFQSRNNSLCQPACQLVTASSKNIVGLIECTAE